MLQAELQGPHSDCIFKSAIGNKITLIEYLNCTLNKYDMANKEKFKFRNDYHLGLTIPFL